MTSRYFRLALVLGLLSAIGPFAVDMYLPALPSVGRDLSADMAAVQWSLLAFFLSMGAGQLLAGPLADILGRKAPLYGGLALFAVGSIGAALAPDIGWLVAFRFVQGVGASPGIVVPRAIVRDLHTGVEAARLMSLLMLVFSVSPILAPLVGTLIIGAFGWRGVFWAVTIAAALAAVLLTAGIRETRSVEARRASSLAGALAGYGRLLRDANFVGLSLIGGFAISSFFVYLASSSFVLIDHYRLTPTLYSLFFSLNAVSFFAMSQLTGRFADRFGLARVVRVAIAANVAVVALLLVAVAAGFQSLGVLAGMLFVGYGALGLVIPSTSVLAMEEYGEIAGTASALMGTLQLLTGAVAMAVSGLFFDGTPLPMVAAVFACSGVAFAATQVVLGRRRELPAEATP